MRVLQSAPISLSTLQPTSITSPAPTNTSLQIIFPGTLWCGPGSLTENNNELGTFQATDWCCRQHDSCPDLIAPGESKFGLTNNAAYYVLHCDCDAKLLQCLKADSSLVSNIIGFLYFEAINTHCFREDYPIIKCASFKDKITHRRCERYELNTTAPKLHQFFDVCSML